MSRAEIPYNNSDNTTQNTTNRIRGLKRARISASCIFMMVTILMTVTASGLIVISLVTDYWEYMEIDKTQVTQVADNDTQVQWLMEGRVARLSFPTNIKMTTISTTSVMTKATRKRPKRDAMRTAFLVPKHSGVWAVCINLKEQERKQLIRMGYEHAQCKQYLSPEFPADRPNDWMTRMQNLSISCSIVGLILLGMAVFVGFFGILKRQISAVLVTSVMYILAAVFCVFTLFIMQFKKRASKQCGLIDPSVPFEYRHAQISTNGWSFAVGWFGVALCIVTAFLWYLLSKILRYGPITLTYRPN